MHKVVVLSYRPEVYNFHARNFMGEKTDVRNHVLAAVGVEYVLVVVIGQPTLEEKAERIYLSLNDSE